MKTAFVLLLVLFLAALCPGCASIRAWASRPPAAEVRAGSSSIAQNGAAAVPATAGTSTTTTAATIPPGVAVTAHPDGSLSWTNAAPLQIVTTRTAENVTGPAAFPPPALPTPAEEAKGRASLWMWLGLVAGGAAAVFGIVRGWDVLAAGGGAIATGCVIGLAIGSAPGWLLFIFGVGAAACFIGPVIWHTKLKPRIVPSPAPPG